MSRKRVIEGNPGAPLAKGVVAGDLLFLSGQLAGAGNLVPSMGAQTKKTLENIAQALADCGSSVENVVKATIYITDMDAKPEMDAAYREFFGSNLPARTTVGVKDLGQDVLIEIDIVAVLDA